MSNNLYRIVLTGELFPGYTVDGAVRALAQLVGMDSESLRIIFEEGNYPLDQDFSADEALEVQSRLERHGIRARIEKRPNQRLKLSIKPEEITAAEAQSTPEPTKSYTPPAPPSAMVRCPTCGYEQEKSDHCSSCGAAMDALAQTVVLDQSPLADTVILERSPLANDKPPKAQPAPHFADEFNPPAWDQDNEPQEPDERELMSVFVGQHAPMYMRKFERFQKGQEMRFALSWNWGAFLQPFLWAMYRKLWMLALLIFLTGVIAPMFAFIAGDLGLLSPKLVPFSYLLYAVNMIFWALVVDYIYFREVKFNLVRIVTTVPDYSMAVELSASGGVSHSAVMVGTAFSSVLALFIWSIIDSMQVGPSAQDLEIFGEDISVIGIEKNQLPTDGVEVAGQTDDSNRWTFTRRKLRTLAQSVNTWLNRHAEAKDPALFSFFKLREDMNIPEKALLDGWGSEVQYVSETEGYRLISPGPDRLFGTADDMQYRKVLDE